jgi:hypothetical protein
VADRLPSAALAAIVCALIAAPAAGAGGPPALSVGFWCGPPIEQSTPDRFLQVLNAGFTFSMPPCTEASPTVAENRRVLDAAAITGVPVVVRDERIERALTDPSARAQLLDATVQSYSSYPALGGYYVYDEVPPELIGDAAAVVAGLRARDPQHPGFVSVFPNYAPISDYDRYLRDFVRQIRPAELVYNYYPFLGDGTERTGFFANLSSVRRVARESSIPFWDFTQLTKLEGYRRASENEKLWQALQLLAYGAHGILYFTYWSYVSADFPEPGVIDPATGLPTGHYAEVQRVNAQARAFARYLVPATSRSVFHNGPLAPGAVPRRPGAPIYFPSRAAITTGLFDSANYTYTMLANREYRARVSTRAVLSFGTRRPERLDVSTGRWRPVHAIRARKHSVTIKLTLGPAAGALVRIRKPAPPGPPGAEVVFGRMQSNAGEWYLVDSGVAPYRLRDARWSTCPSGFKLIGRKVEPDGIWLCARTDLAARAFYVGNVVHGARRYYRVRSGAVKRLRPAPRFSCPVSSRLVGKFLGANGFWLCLGPRRNSKSRRTAASMAQS